jgi:hypothetical protein
MLIVVVLSSTAFLRTRNRQDNVADGSRYLGFIFYSVYFMNASAWSELSITVSCAALAYVLYVQHARNVHTEFDMYSLVCG